MRTIVATRFGASDILTLVERPTPVPGIGELRVDVNVVGVGWLDTRIRAGQGPNVFRVAPPYVPGSAVGGTVAAVGDGVDQEWIGARVISRPSGGIYGGGYADTVIASPESTFRVPAGLDLSVATALMDDASTALAVFEKTPAIQGEYVLVAPGLGGLGHVLVQIARAAGATVIAAVRGAEKVAVARRLTPTVVNYAERDWPEQVLALTKHRGLDVVFDGIGGAIGASSLALLADGGRFSAYGMTSGAQTAIGEADRRRVTVVDMSQLPEFWPDTSRRVKLVLQEAALGRINPIIGQTYPLAEAAAAHADIEARRVMGKTLLLA
ncbi:zinc-binding dehydrogenase [Pendulispora rubella]|uniref:Zinc-binding dehydrogenase n=1 Tax=Pendulispora rubella TaxID=2741070 RepID=A0ABZ2L4W5_9BACT